MLHVPLSWPALWQTYLKVILTLKLVFLNLVTPNKRGLLYLTLSHTQTHTCTELTTE